MKKSLLLFYLLFFTLVFSQNNMERITSFHSDIVVNKDGGIDVTENIKVHSLGEEIKRGIFRALPTGRNLNNRTQQMNYRIISVKKDGADEDFHKKNEDGFLKIYIGKTDVNLSPGDYTYEIRYTTEKQIGFFEKYDEFYWNVNGLEWNFAADSVSAKVTLPLGSRIIQNSCYKGSYGDNSQNCLSKNLSDNIIEWSNTDFQPKEGLTIAVGFNKGIIALPSPPTFLEKYGILIVGIFIFSGLLMYFYSTWKKYGIDPEKPIVYPQFNAPDNLSPASLGYIRTEFFTNNYLSAALVNLAIKGYVKIIETENSGLLGFFKSKIFTVKKLKDADESLPKEEINLINTLFSENSEEVNFDGKYDSKIEKAVLNFKETLKFQHDKFLNEGNNTSKIILPTVLITVFYAVALFLSYQIFPEAEKIVIGIILFVVLSVALVGSLVLFKIYPLLFKFFLAVPVIIFIVIGFFIVNNHDFVVDINFNFCYIFIVLAFTALIIYGYLIKRPSEEKLQKKSLIEGFKMYMGAAENEQIKFHNPPKMTPEFFEKLLPFAMVLGVDDIWGEKFNNLLSKMPAEYQNNWYVGSSSMNYLMLTSSLNSSLTHSIQSASTKPSSSGSGSGGGGFSGGGGGGGGGGGW